MTIHTIISHYNHLHGKPVSIDTLRKLHSDIQKYLEANGSGPGTKELSDIRKRVALGLKKMASAGADYVDRVNVKQINLGAPPAAAFVAMEKKGKLWPRVNPDKIKTGTTNSNVIAEALPIAKIHTDTKRFQNRHDAYSEASADSVAKNYDPNKFDPIVIWKDTKNKKLFVLSGHSRYEGMKRRKAKTIPARYFKGTEEQAIKFAKVEANRAANIETLVEDLAAYRLMRDGDTARDIKQLSKAELQRIFKGKVQKLEAYSHLSAGGLFINALSQINTSNYPYLERNAQWIGQLRKENPVIGNAGEDNIFHFFYSDKAGKHLKLSKDDFFALAKKKIAQLGKGENILFPECSSEGCVKMNDKESDPVKGESYKRLREISESLQSITEKLTSKKANVKVSTEDEKKYLRNLAAKLTEEKERIQRDLDLMDKSQSSLFGVDFEIISRPSKSGKRTVYYPTIGGKRITATNFGKKWEARRLAEDYLKWIKNKKLEGPQYDAFHIQPTKKHKGPLNKLQMQQLQDAIKSGRTPKVNLKAKMNAKKQAAPLFDEMETKDPKQASLFGAKKGVKGLGFISADQMPDTPADTFQLPGEVGKLLGKLQAYKLEIIVSGETHSGKSELAKQIANAFIKAGHDVAYVDWEHGGLQSKDTQDGIRRNIEAGSKNKLLVNGDVPRTLEAVKDLAKHFKVIVLDSGTKIKGQITNAWVDELRESHPNTIWVVTMQQNEKGGTRGGSAAEYDAPVMIKTYRPDHNSHKSNYALVEKNRGNTTGTRYNISSKKIEKPQKAA